MKKVMATVLVFVLSFSLCSCGNPSDLVRNTDIDIINSEATISLDEFNKIENGMSYSEVCDIVGGEGTLSSSSDIGLGAEYKTDLYQWSGDGSIGANANVMFQNNKVISKAQVGLK